jgi:hypothetical protein
MWGLEDETKKHDFIAHCATGEEGREKSVVVKAFDASIFQMASCLSAAPLIGLR